MLDPWFKKTYPLKHLKKMLYWPWASYRVLRDAGAVLFTSNEEQLLAGESFWPYKVRGTVVKYGTRAATGNTESQLEAFFERFPELRGKRLLLFVGRIDLIKGCDLIIRAFSEVLARNRDWHLVMAGPDQNGLRPSLDRIGEEAQVGNRITWTGMIAGDVKFGAFRASEALLLPSHHENFGIAVAESLAYGLPVLISNKVNIWREIQADGGGFVAEDDLAGACQLLRTWEALPVERKVQMRAAAAKCFETRFEIHNAASCLVKTLTEVIERNRPHMLVEQVEG
jgi:glycosyltransferase involved in cell wall biosynthesis